MQLGRRRSGSKVWPLVRAADEIELTLSDQSGQNSSTIVLAVLGRHARRWSRFSRFGRAAHAVRGGVITA